MTRHLTSLTIDLLERFVRLLATKWNAFLIYTKGAYLAYRIGLRLIRGKAYRDQYFSNNRINLGDFLLFERPLKINGIKAIPRKHTADFNLLFHEKEYEVESRVDLNNGETFLDVGANVGRYTLKAATQHSDIKVVSIEAHPKNYKALCRNISCNGFSNIITVNKAVSDKKGKIALYEHITENNRLLTDDFSINAAAGQYAKKKSSIEVESDTIDNILREIKIERPDVLKMDIEGAEVLALKGAKQTLAKLRKIIVEIHLDNLQQVKDILVAHNFDIEVIDIPMMTWHYYYVVGTKRFHEENRRLKEGITA
jgi:FkbM family methyltransferase